jgi:hypothetical protein
MKSCSIFDGVGSLGDAIVLYVAIELSIYRSYFIESIMAFVPVAFEKKLNIGP